jgi:hypothetical protein
MQAMDDVHLKDVSQHDLPSYLLREDVDNEELAKNGYFRKVIALYHAPYTEVLLRTHATYEKVELFVITDV